MTVETRPVIAPSNTASNVEARLAGLFYLGTILCGLFAEIAVREHFRSMDDSQMMSALVREQHLYRLGEAADLIMLCCYIAVTGLLYRLLAPKARSTALIAAGFSLIGIAVLAVAGLFHLLPLAKIDQTILAPAALTRLAFDLHGKLYGISLVFFGIYCSLIGWLCLNSRRLPAIVGWLMLIGGATHVVTKFLWIVEPAALHFVPPLVNLLPLVGEAALALWLLLFGVRTERSDAPSDGFVTER